MLATGESYVFKIVIRIVEKRLKLFQSVDNTVHLYK